MIAKISSPGTNDKEMMVIDGQKNLIARDNDIDLIITCSDHSATCNIFKIL